MTHYLCMLSAFICLLAGCSNMDRTPEPLAAPTPAAAPVAASLAASVPLAASPRAKASPTAEASRGTVIHTTAIDRGSASKSDSAPELLPASINNGTVALRPTNATFQPRTVQEALQPPAILEDTELAPPTIDLDLTGALAMAGGQSPRIAFAAARYREAYARLESARTLWLPTIRAGVSYNHHDGRLQASDGSVLDASRSSLQSGLGVQAVGAGSPAVPGVVTQFHSSDAWFQPKITGFAASAQNAAATAVTNDTLLATALAHLELLRATQQLRIAEDTHGNAEKLASLTDTFARTGQGPQADADRARTELVRRRNEVSRARESARVASARLGEILSLDPSVEITPQEPTIVAIDLVSHEMPNTELIATGLANRPELAEAQNLVCEAVNRYRREKYAPLLPSVLLGISQSGFGGGLGANINNYRDRFDFDAVVYWELRNFGLGERAKRNEMSARRDQALALKASMMDRVAREVVEAHAQVKSRKGRIQVAEAGVASATTSYDRNLTRIREGQGLPIEALQSLQALDDARQEYLRTLADYNEAQFRLQRALGWPIQ